MLRFACFKGYFVAPKYMARVRSGSSAQRDAG
ncbi:uncharacterized protein METZ01_LOCUS407153, partial [marine metagenome]